MNRIIILLILSLIMQSCHKELLPAEYIVVEGWIESGQGPVVILTKSFVVAEKGDIKQSGDANSVVLPWGKVTVTDGTDTIVLTGGIDKNYYPSYVYKSDHIIGEPGGTYKLQVEYGDNILTATTTIPLRDSLEAVKVERINEKTYQINAYFNDDPSNKDYYMFFTKLHGKETRYYPSFLGLFDDDMLSLNNSCQVFPGIHTLTDSVYEYSSYYEKGDSVLFKFAKIDRTTYEIHKSYNDIVALASNPVFVSDLELKTNIIGGLGFWCGYAATDYRVVISDSIKTQESD